MADLPSQHPSLSLHLADDTLTPLITSSRSRAHLASLTSLAASALVGQAAAQRVGMGAVERIVVEYPSASAAAAVVVQSYLHAPEAGSGAAAGSEEEQVPRLVGVVVAKSPQDAKEAKRAAARLERVGRELQSRWSGTGSS
ncbi:hypothetical protein MY3296_007795 [Beauveria thailandica]